MNPAGINIGYGHTKIRTHEDYTVFPSVSSPANTTFTGLGLDRKTRTVQFKGVAYEVGEDAALLSNDPSGGKVCRPRWLDSIPYQVLRQATIDVLHESSPDDSDWTVVLGVAVEHFKDSAYVEKLRSAWLGNLVTSSGKTIRVSACQVVPEPMGAYWSLTLSDKDLKARSKDSTVLVIDIGYYTTDWIAIHDNHLVPGLSSGVNQGMHALFLELQRHLQVTYGQTIDLVQLESIVRNQKPIRIRGQETGLDHILSPALERVMPRIASLVLESILPATQRDVVFILTGGGASLLKPYLCESLPNGTFYSSGNPQQDNADGYWMLAKALMQEPEDQRP